MSLHLELTGDREAVANLRRIASALSQDRLEAFGSDALEPVAQRARDLAPVRSGNLRDSIRIAPERLQLDGAQVQRYNLHPETGIRSGGMLVGVLDVEAFYAWFLEFGTVKMRAQPFLIPAIESEQTNVFEIFGNLVGRAILTAVE